MSNLCKLYSEKQRNAIIKFLDSLKKELQSCTGTPKKKRPLTDYQKHMKHCATGVEKGGEGKSFKQCVQEWNKNKS